MTEDAIEVNGVRYVREDAASVAANKDGLPYVVIRSRDSGAHAGYLKARNGAEVELVDARRIWYWSGAASLSQLALDGVSDPANCKFPAAVPTITVLGVCEVIPASQKARKSIEGVKPWKK